MENKTLMKYKVIKKTKMNFGSREFCDFTLHKNSIWTANIHDSFYWLVSNGKISFTILKNNFNEIFELIIPKEGD